MSRPPNIAGSSVARISGSLLAAQYRIVRRRQAGAVAGRSSEPLHDLRVAIRRFRAVLRFFRKTLAGTSLATLDRALDRLNRSLGSARDADVWLDCLQKPALQRKVTDRRRWPAFRENQIACRRRQQAVVRRILRGRDYRMLCRKIEHFLRVELPRTGADSPADGLRRFVASKLGRLFLKVLKRPAPRPSDAPEQAHRTRILVRRARYWSEFFAPLLGPAALKLGARLKDVADETGWVRDLDLHLSRFCRTRPAPPRRLIKLLKRRRRAHAKKARKAWRRLRQRRFKRRILDALTVTA